MGGPGDAGPVRRHGDRGAGRTDGGLAALDLSRVEGLVGVPATEGNDVVRLRNGDEIFPSMLSAMRAAQHTITFETYIYWSGAIGKEFSEAFYNYCIEQKENQKKTNTTRFKKYCEFAFFSGLVHSILKILFFMESWACCSYDGKVLG